MGNQRSAGILLYRFVEGEPQALLVHPGGPLWAKKDSAAWSIPKGEYDEAENPKTAALREFEEELGSPVPVATDDLIDLGSICQKGGKQVRAWAGHGDFDPAGLRSNTFEMEWPPRSGVEREFPEVDRAEWFGPDEAREKINPAQVALLDRLLEHLRG